MRRAAATPARISLIVGAACAIASGVSHAQSTFTLSGTISGLRGSGLTLSTNGQTVTIPANATAFTFPTAFAGGTAYNVTLTTRPSSPTQGCLIGNGRGVLNADVTNIAVACVTSMFTVGGTVTGLEGQGLTLRFNDQLLHITANGTFAYPRPMLSGTSYDVAVVGQPGLPTQRCAVTNGSGTVAGKNISDIAVHCTTTLEVSGSTPGNGESNVSRVHAASLYFNLPLNEATVTGDTVRLVGHSGGSIDLDLSVSTGTMLSLRPRTPMLPETAYTIEVGSGLRGTRGEQLAGPAAVSFVTGQASWQGAQIIASGGNWPHNARITTRNGTFATVWMHAPGVIGLIRYTRTGWFGPTFLNLNRWAQIYDPQVMLDSSGTAHVIWDEGEGTLLSSRHTIAAGWSAVESVATDGTGSPTSPRAAMDDAGNIVVTWQSQWTANTTSAWANRHVAGSGWGTPVRLDNSNDSTSNLHLVSNAAGDAMTLWRQDNAFWSSRYTPTGSWATAERVYGSPEMSAGWSLHADMHTNGDAVAVYIVSPISNVNATKVMASSRASDGGWATSVPITGSLTGTSWSPQVALDDDGNAFAIWIQRRLGATDEIWSNARPVGGAWGAPRRVAQSSWTFQNVQLAMEGRKHPLIVMRDVRGTTSSILATRIRPSGWIVGPIETHPTTTSVVEPWIATDESGSALAVWISNDPAGHQVKANVLE